MRRLSQVEVACLSAAARHKEGYLMYDEVQRKAADKLAKLGLVKIKDGEYPNFGRVFSVEREDV